MRVIFHVDFDSYFVSALRTVHKHLINKPVAVGNKNSTSVATALSYEAKALGVKAGEPFFLIKQKVPNIIVVPADFPLFIKISSSIFDWIMAEFSSIVEIGSIDECYIDVTELVPKHDRFEKAKKLALSLQKQIKNKFSIPVSIGISYNKFLAKMTTNLSKPYGVKVTKKEDIKKHFYGLDISEFFGIGKSYTKKLRDQNINTIQDLFDNHKNTFMLRNIFGRNYVNIVDALLGKSTDIVNTKNNEYKNIGNSVTFTTEPLSNIEQIEQIFNNLCWKVAKRAQNRNIVGNVLTIELKYFGKKFLSHQRQIINHTNDEKILVEIASELLSEFWDQTPVKGAGFRLGGLKKADQTFYQSTLQNEQQYTNVNFKIIDQVNQKMGKKVLVRASDYLKIKHLKSNQSKFLEEDIEVVKKKVK